MGTAVLTARSFHFVPLSLESWHVQHPSDDLGWFSSTVLPVTNAVVTLPGMLALAENTATAAVKQPEKVAATRQEIFQGE